MNWAESLIGWWKEKTGSPLYLTYLVFVIFWNWKSVYILFFESEERLNRPRIEYLNEYMFESGIAFLDPLLNMTLSFVPPLIFTYFSIKYLPYVHAWAHDIHLRHYYARKKAFDTADLQYERGKTTLLKEKGVQKRQQQVSRKQIESSLTQEERWEKEFEVIKADEKNVVAIKAAYETVYTTSGRFGSNTNSFLDSGITHIEPDILSRIDTLEIAVIDWRTSRLTLTAKGKYFLRLLGN